MELVSVVIPTHNRVNLLINAIKSVQNQTYKNLEIIIVDDASKDETESVVKSINDIRIRYIRVEESKGGNYARNLGVKHARGNYIAFLDDDDEWYDTKIEEQMRLFTRDENIGLVYTGAEILYPSLDIKYIRKPNERGDLSNTIIYGNCIGTTSSVVVRKEVFQKVGGFDIDLPALQDYDLWIRMCQISNVDYVDRPLIKYHHYHSTTQITDNLDKIIKSVKIIHEKYIDLLNKLPLDEQKEWISNKYILFGKRKLRSSDKKGARKYFIKAFKEYPSIKSIKFLIASFLSYETVIKIRKYIN